MAADEIVLQRLLLEPDRAQILARRLHSLLDCQRQLAGLAVAIADTAVAVADHGQSRKAELTAALDDLGDAVHRDELLL